MKKRLLVRLVVCLIATALAGCSGDDPTDDLLTEQHSQAAAPFQWTRAQDVETRHEFLRNLGVGYSYNAVRGSYCDWQDIRCQVLNRAVLLDVQEATGDAILRTSLTEEVFLSSNFEYSFRDYVVNMETNTKEAIDLGLYHNTKRQRQYFIEDGVQERYFYTLSEKTTLAHQFVGWANVMALYWKHKNLLTESFRNAVDHIDDSDVDDIAAVDSFINVWGTHVIVESWLGGAIHVDLMNDMWRWTAMAKDEKWTTEAFLDSVATKDERRKSSNEFRWTEHSRINVMARGGNQESLTGLLGEHRFDGTRSFSTKGVDIWRQSLYYDPDDEVNSNAEMVDMKVLPIWEFANLLSPQAALRIQAAVTKDAALMQKLLGDRNFFDARFPIRYATASCQWRKATGTWQQATRTDSSGEPMIVNIMSGGRYVATVCHETIDGHDLWVCYPIYEGRVKLACGTGVDDNNKGYGVRWVGGKATLTPLKTVSDGQNFYINGGAVELKAKAGTEYPAYQALPYYELSGGIKPDGSYAAEAYAVTKDGEDFRLLAPGEKTDIVGFTDTGKPSGTNYIYKRNDNYVYIYNQNEMK